MALNDAGRNLAYLRDVSSNQPRKEVRLMKKRLSMVAVLIAIVGSFASLSANASAAVTKHGCGGGIVCKF